jgi:tripeptide aminopeptidase
MDLGTLSRHHLESVIAIDSQSDERSSSIPSSEGQRRLADWLAGFFAQQGCAVDRDAQANVLCALPGRGAGAGKPPLALLVHLDTSRGTAAVPALHLVERWGGGRIPYPRNDRLWVDIDTYPAAREFLGHSLLHGPGEAPFGLDDKLGLAHLMTLAVLLREDPGIDHPPLLFVGRPDEEIGRMAAVEGLADELQRRGVRHGFTIDGVLPYEINVENFNGSHASIVFHDRPLVLDGPDGLVVRVALGGVNTHGCTAKAEGYRAATRLSAEILAALRRAGVGATDVVPLSLRSHAERDCDGDLTLLCRAAGQVAALEAAVRDVVGPHVRRGASFRITPPEPMSARAVSGAALDLLSFVEAFFASDPGFVLPAEESEARQGYSNPYRACPEGTAGLRLDIRLRDFDRQALSAREDHVRRLGEARGLEVQVTQQYENMGPRLLPHRALIDWPRQAAATLGIEPRVLPIRGGTGVDPFLDRGVAIGNLGTGYFAPESEKEFTSLEMLAGHARWLVALVQTVANS